MSLAAWGVTDLVPLAGDASTRRYLRGRDRSGRSVVVMEQGSALPADFPFLRWQARYEALGIRVPAVLGVDREAGRVLLEDLGNELLQHRVESLGAEACAPLYERAVHWGLMLAHADVPRDGDEDPLVAPRLALEMDLLLAWLARVPMPADSSGLPPLHRAAAALDASSSAALRRARELMHALCSDVHSAGPMAPCHRDYHARNLVVIDEGTELAVIDFQDTRRGPRAYDLASLAWDPYVTLPAAMIAPLVDEWRPRGVTRGAWEREVRLAAGQRLLKAAGSYAWLSRDQGKPQYAQWLQPALSRAWDRLEGWSKRDELRVLLTELAQENEPAR